MNKEKEPIYSFVGKEYVCQGLKLLKLGCELKFVSDILIMILRMSGLKKNILVLKKNSY